MINTTIYIFILSIIVTSSSFSQIQVQVLDGVPEEFERRYFEEQLEWNPLHVGDTFMYDSDKFFFITKDTTVDDKVYYKKYIHWYNTLDFKYERYDFETQCSYELDVNDLDFDSVYNEELLLDSFNVATYAHHHSFRWMYRSYLRIDTTFEIIVSPERQWVVLSNDTVLSVAVRYAIIFTGWWADKFGYYKEHGDFYTHYLIYAVINGVRYGTPPTGINTVNNATPDEFKLYQNYPNPFNSSTFIQYYLPSDTYIDISIYDIQGKMVKQIDRDMKRAGKHRFRWTGKTDNGGELSSGAYFVVLKHSKQSKIIKTLYLK